MLLDAHRGVRDYGVVVEEEEVWRVWVESHGVAHGRDFGPALRSAVERVVGCTREERFVA